MFDDIENDNPYFQVYLKDIKVNDPFGEVEHVEFGTIENYVLINSAKSYALFSLSSHNLGQCTAKRIDVDLYARILDVQMTSEGYNNGEFKLMLACDVHDVNRVDVFDVMHTDEEMMMITHASLAKGGDLKVFI